jgi:hypothetical protein
MSTKTTFKRIALVAVAALGLGVLSVAPSSAAVSAVVVTVANGTAGLNGAASDTVTGAQISVSGLLDEGTDSITVQFVQRAAYPAGAVVVPNLIWLESTTPNLASSTRVDNAIPFASATTYSATESVTASGGYTITGTTSGTGTYVGAKFALFLDSNSAASSDRKAGTYSYTVIVKQFNRGVQAAVATTSHNVDIVIAAAATASKVASAANTTAFIGAVGATNSSDSLISAVSTADGTNDAEIDMVINNAAGGTSVAHESVTATITGAGVISFDGTTFGKSIKYSVTTGAATISIRGDGTAGTGSIAISTGAGFTATKTINFYAAAAKTITAAVAQPVLAIGANAGAISVSAVDASGTNWTGAAYIVASAAADALVAGSATTPVACDAWNSTDGILCPVTAIAAGTAKFKVIDASTVALATATSNEVTVTVSANPAASVKIAFDKATYAPFEKAIITVTPLDKDGKTLQGALRTNILAAGGITTNIAFGSLSDTLTASTVNSSATTGTGTTAGSQSYVVYMPAQGDVTIKATGGTALPLTGQVAVSATATIVNSSVDAATDAANEATDAANAATDAALAAADAADAATAAAQDASDAVAALSASVSKLISSLRAQITSLTNLVIKIQKKVKA